jgi:hypothetical protein
MESPDPPIGAFLHPAIDIKTIQCHQLSPDVAYNPTFAVFIE